MKRTIGTLVAGLGLALLTVVMFAGSSTATGTPTDFDNVASEIDSAKAAFDADNLKAASFFDKRLDAAKKGVLAAKTQAGKSNKRGVGTAIKSVRTILRGIKSRLTNNNARKQIPQNVRDTLTALIDKLVTDVQALK